MSFWSYSCCPRHSLNVPSPSALGQLNRTVPFISLRQEPYEVIPQVRICAGDAGQPASLPRPFALLNTWLTAKSDLSVEVPFEDEGGSNPQAEHSLNEVLIRCHPVVFLIYWDSLNFDNYSRLLGELRGRELLIPVTTYCLLLTE